MSQGAISKRRVKRVVSDEVHRRRSRTEPRHCEQMRSRNIERVDGIAASLDTSADGDHHNDVVAGD
jgi:hypothetical protein